MKKTTLISSLLAIGVLFVGFNAFAADGDLIVNGNVGIGTTSPVDSVHISKNSTSVSFGTLPGILVSNLSTDEYSFAAVRANAGNGAVSGGFFTDGLGTGSTLGRQGTFFGTFTNHPIGFGTNGAERMSINTSGQVGVGTTNPGTYKLYVNGDLGAWSGTWTGSDTRWKKNIEPIGDALFLIDGIQGVRYDWNADALRDRFTTRIMQGTRSLPSMTRYPVLTTDRSA